MGFAHEIRYSSFPEFQESFHGFNARFGHAMPRDCKVSREQNMFAWTLQYVMDLKIYLNLELQPHKYEWTQRNWQKVHTSNEDEFTKNFIFD